MRAESGGYRRDHLRARAQCVEVDAKEVRMGSKSVLLRTLIAGSSARMAGLGVPSSVTKWCATTARERALWRKWRATVDEDGHYSFAVVL